MTRRPRKRRPLSSPIRASIEALREAFYLDRAERIAAAPNPEAALFAASFHDAVYELAQPTIEALMLYGEAPEPWNPDPEVFAETWARAIHANRGYLERIRSGDGA